MLDGIAYFGLSNQPEDEPFYINICESCMYQLYTKHNEDVENISDD